MDATFNFQEEKYTSPKNWITNAIKLNHSWESTDMGLTHSEEELTAFLKQQTFMSFWPEMSNDEWHKLVAHVRAINTGCKPGFIGDPQKPQLAAPTSPTSCWQLYKKKLTKKGFTEQSLFSIEEATKKVISQISDSTPQTDPVRGMVMGNVQSGKTANMAAVIAMAADFGYNFFLVLTGTIENLRKQTQRRLLGDLKNPEDVTTFEPLDNPCATSPYGQRLYDLLLEEGSNKRYMCVCLKNGSRLKDLLVWINACDAKKGKLKILVLDDEADQAGINTLPIDKKTATTINKRLKNIVFGQDNNGKYTHPYGAMNYIGYTATPYGNLLNEASDSSLYPKNFILCLPTPAEYIGPQQIFGLIDECEGLPIINDISVDEIQSIKKTISFGFEDAPSALKNALLWFVCCLATARYWGLKQPFTMLIHTSQKIVLHSEMEESVENFFTALKKEKYLPLIKQVWEDQTSKMTLSEFLEGMPNYHNGDKIRDYPSFEQIENEIKSIVEGGLSHIMLADDGTKFEFSDKIHLCVDNCSQNFIEDDIMMRIVYPEKDDLQKLEKAPGFIVIGGATLSRGLTLEGLTCSYFLRTTTMADTLMQMGRWFGYRQGYELLPRIWLSKQAQDQYIRLSLLDYNLRHEINVMQDLNMPPKEYGPRIDSFPDYRALVITAKNKSQKAQSIEVAYGNKSGQTTKFYKADKVNEDNVKAAVGFVDSLGPIDKDRIKALNNPYIDDENPANIWFDVDYGMVFDFLQSLSFPTQVATLGDIPKVREWFQKEFDAGHLKNWDIVLSSTNKGRERTFKHVSIGMPVRTQLNPALEENSVEAERMMLKTITAPSDMLLDVADVGLDPNVSAALRSKDISKLNELLGKKSASMAEKRIAFKKFDTPLLVLYFIDKESGQGDPDCQPSGGKLPKRIPLGTSEDLFGYYVYIPYGVGADGKPLVVSNGKVTVKLEFDQEADVNEDEVH